MGLGFASAESGGGDFLPYVKFDTRSGDMIHIERVQTGEGWEKEESDVEKGTKMVMDLGNIEVGWLDFASGVPSVAVSKLGTGMPQRPNNDHKQGFRVRLFNKEMGLSTFSHNGKIVCRVVDELHNSFEEGQDGDKVPVVEFAGTEKVEIDTPKGKNTFKAPKFKIVKWVPRPDGLDAAPEQDTAPVKEAEPEPEASEDDEW